MINLFDTTFSLLKHALDLRAAKQRVLASNIANMETPGYRARDIDFSAELRRRLGGTPLGLTPVRTERGHIPAGGAAPRGAVLIIEEPRAQEGYDRNTVNVEKEMAKLSENSLKFNLAARMIRRKFATLMNAIKEGGR